MIDLVSYLHANISKLTGLNYDSERRALVFDKAKSRSIIDAVDSSRISIEDIGNNQAEIDIDRFSFYFYFDERDFETTTTKNKWDKPSYIYSSNAFYDVSSETTYVNFKIDNEYYLLQNNHHYFNLLKFLKSQEHREDSIFYFVDYFSWDAKIIVLTTLKKEGKLTIPFSDSGLHLPEDISLNKNLERFKAAFSEASKHFPKFIKNEVFTQLTKYNTGQRMSQFLEKLGEIINVAEQNFEIYLHDLSLENLKKDFIDHKNKYFNQLREILSKLTNQVIGLPITIAASVFSIYKVSDSVSTLIIILFVFVLYAGYSIFLLRLQKDDIRDIREMFSRDFTYIEDSQFFKKFPDQLDDFQIAKQKIESRITYLLSAIDIYYTLFVLSVLSFITYVLIQLTLQILSILLIMLIALIVCVAVFFILIK